MAKYKDCEICEKLIKDKHKSAKLWKLFCIIFIVTTAIFAILYFSKITLGDNTTIDMGNENHIGNDVSGDMSGDGNVVVGNGEVNNKVKTKDYAPVICASVIFCVAILVLGVCSIAIYVQKKD